MPPPPTRAPWALPGGGSGGAAASPLATATSSSGSGSAENEGKLPYRPDFFHLVFMLAAAYLVMIFTG